MKTTKKEKRVMAFLLLLLSITVGYALLSQTLNINGTAKIKKTTWKVIWDNVVVNENSVSGDAVTSAAEITNTEKTLVEYSITLSKPGDFYEFTVDAKNEGTIDAMVNIVSNKVYESNGTTEKELPEYLTYSVTYSNGQAIQKNHLLKSGSTETYKVRVEFADVTADKLPSEEETLKFKFSVDYVQADENGQEVVHGLTGTRYTVNISDFDPETGNIIENTAVWIGKKPVENISLYETVSAAKAAFSNKTFYLKHVIENDIVKESYVCFERNSKTYCLRGLDVYKYDENQGNYVCDTALYPDCKSPYYESNKEILKEAFGENNCADYSNRFDCEVDGLYPYINEDGDAVLNTDDSSCEVQFNGSSFCGE